LRKLTATDIGPMLGQSGGQGSVYELAGEPARLIKLYHPHIKVEMAGLDALVAWRHGLNRTDRAVIDRSTAWPQDTVEVDDGRVGIEMPRAPGKFFHIVQGKRADRNLSWAYLADATRWAGQEPAAPAVAVRVVKQLASVFDVFTRNGIAYGDLSHSNVLWSGGHRPDIYLIDCDAAWVVGGQRGLEEAQTALWTCPWPGVQGQERDAYKLALAFLRVVMRFEADLDGNVRTLDAPAHPPVTVEVVELLEAGLRERGPRPEPGRWIPALDTLERGLRARRIA
jgi:hypothetical protein